jgi:glutamine amidotransferase
MNRSTVTIIDYGAGNILSVQRSLERFNANVVVTSDPKQIVKANKVILPGVGAFPHAMRSLKSLGIDQAILEFGASGKPLLGICLGMQLLMESSDEFEHTEGLGFFRGHVSAIPAENEGIKIRSPHIGWNELILEEKPDKKNSILKNLRNNEWMYFAHAYSVVASDRTDVIALCKVSNLEICAGIQRNNITGLQFHPEKSASEGLKIMKQFLEQ